MPGTAFRAQMFLDGRPVGSPIHCGENHDPDLFPVPTNGQFVVGTSSNARAGSSVVIDDLKVWNYAKTDFSASL